MTRFTLYLTVTDTLGRVHGHLYALDDGIQRKPPNKSPRVIEEAAERVLELTKKHRTTGLKRSELRRIAKGSGRI